MLRPVHKFPGLLAALLVSILALSGAVLSIFPALDRTGAVTTPAGSVSVADLAGRVAGLHPDVEQIRRTPSGKVIAFYFENGIPASVVVDPASGQTVAEYAPSALERWMTNLHRSLFLDDTGRMVAGLGAAAMLLLALSGLQMTARRLGGWRRILGPARGSRRQRLHVDFGRLSAAGLILSALTGIYMSLSTFELIPDGSARVPSFPNQVSGGPTMVVDRIEAFRNIDLNDLRELTFPYPGDSTDAYGIKTAAGEGYVDQATGQVLVWKEQDLAQQVYETVYRLHTGQGLWWLGLILGMTALAVPIMSMSGVLVWASGRRARPRIKANVPAQAADTVILVGSEGGSTWGFARGLHNALTAAGHMVHTAPMDSLASRYRGARRMFILTATYGDGGAPRSAGRFMARIEAMDAPAFPVAVLGFGDRQFPRFCRFAQDIEQTLARKSWASLMPFATIDRQSTQAFSRWGEALSEALGEAVTLTHVPARPRSHALTLLTRRDYGEAVQAPTSILRFALPRSGLVARLTGRAFPHFAAGDLIGILPPGSDMPRYYSLASSSQDGVLEICVRKHPGGLCSGYLHELRPGDAIDGFIRPNPEFRPVSGRKPVILIGAGTGVGPLAGFIRANRHRRPMHLYFGGRDPTSDYLYEDEIAGWLKDRRLARVTTAFSRVPARAYVQDRIRQDAEALRATIVEGAQIVVCGGRNMADGVKAALEEVLVPLGLTPALLKLQGRYAEDVY